KAGRALGRGAPRICRLKSRRDRDGNRAAQLRSYHLAHFKANSDLRLQTSDSKHENEQEHCIRASSFLRHSSFAIRHSAFGIRHSAFGIRSMSFAASPRFRSSDRPNDVAILTIHPRRRQMSNSLLSPPVLVAVTLYSSAL